MKGATASPPATRCAGVRPFLHLPIHSRYLRASISITVCACHELLHLPADLRRRSILRPSLLKRAPPSSFLMRRARTHPL